MESTSWPVHILRNALFLDLIWIQYSTPSSSWFYSCWALNLKHPLAYNVPTVIHCPNIASWVYATELMFLGNTWKWCSMIWMKWQRMIYNSGTSWSLLRQSLGWISFTLISRWRFHFFQYGCEKCQSKQITCKSLSVLFMSLTSIFPTIHSANQPTGECLCIIACSFSTNLAPGRHKGTRK